MRRFAKPSPDRDVSGGSIPSFSAKPNLLYNYFHRNSLALRRLNKSFERFYNMNGDSGNSVQMRFFDLGKWKFYYDLDGVVQRTTHICPEDVTDIDDVDGLFRGEGNVRPFHFFKWAVRCDYCFARMPYGYKKKAAFTALMKAKMN